MYKKWEHNNGTSEGGERRERPMISSREGCATIRSVRYDNAADVRRRIRHITKILVSQWSSIGMCRHYLEMYRKYNETLRRLENPG